MTTAKNTVSALNLKVDEAVVYPGRGVGRVTAIEEQEIAGFKLKMFVISFEKENAVIKIPTTRGAKQGLRRVSDAATIDAALEIMTGRARKSKQMWSRRATELDTKVNSGDLLQMAEVVRDLHRAEGESEASFSERGIYDSAVAMIASEVAASRSITAAQAMAVLQESLAKSPRPAKAGKGDEAAEGDDLKAKVA
jgi:CarD family transcriptional regulator